MTEDDRIQMRIKILKDYPNGAIVVSSREYFCKSFIRTYDLNPKLFKIATRPDQLYGVKWDTQIIVTYHQDTDHFWELYDFIHERLKNVKYINY